MKPASPALVHKFLRPRRPTPGRPPGLFLLHGRGADEDDLLGFAEYFDDRLVIVSPRAHVSKHAKVGAGTIVMHGAVVNAGAVVGRNCIINSQALVEHDAVIADHCHVATAAAINSGVHIGAGTFIGSNSSVRQCINIGERCLIGMGQRVLADCEAGTCMPPTKRPL